MGITNEKWVAMSDRAIVNTIGKYIKEQRLRQNKTQTVVADTAGVNPWTISQIENGEPISLMSLIQILRALDLLSIFEVFKIEPQISPLEQAKLDKKKRKRARGEKPSPKKESDW